ncbi:hypothetical protein VPIG_00118 [Vibrio phage PWH3a-P1]|uniref:hypothetical protein n=1 Tax=Vibrio phage PWH3a-P1 TaxID=754058 RepID=UPI0002C10563|nr:hypothetical protein VPIG_00118 [Vibrio phage PWH3a-P1]AGH31975.1 hypothetical protein VPIG_00118 [Vibrio phage PWH3a-P1]
MKNINRQQAIKLLSDDVVYDTLNLDFWYDEENDKYLSIYDILGKLDVTKDEIDSVQNLSYKDLDLLN